MNDLLVKGLTKATTTYLDSQRNPTTDYLIRSLRLGYPLPPKSVHESCVKKIMLGNQVSPITRTAILKEMNGVDDATKIAPLMYYYHWDKQDIAAAREWKKKYLFDDIEIPDDDELDMF